MHKDVESARRNAHTTRLQATANANPPAAEGIDPLATRRKTRRSTRRNFLPMRAVLGSKNDFSSPPGNFSFYFDDAKSYFLIKSK